MHKNIKKQSPYILENIVFSRPDEKQLVSENKTQHTFNKFYSHRVNLIQFHHNFGSYKDVALYAKLQPLGINGNYSKQFKILYCTVEALNKWIKKERSNYDCKDDWIIDGFLYVTKILDKKTAQYDQKLTLPITEDHVEHNLNMIEIITSIMAKYLITSWYNEKNDAFHREIQAAKGRLGGLKRKGKESNNKIKNTDELKQQIVLLRKKSAKITQRELAQQVGVSLGTVNKWLKEISITDQK